MNHQISQLRGLVLGAIWLAWLLGGYAYVAGKGPMGAVLLEHSDSQPLLLYGWALVSASLLFYTIVFIVRGLGKGDTGPSA